MFGYIANHRLTNWRNRKERQINAGKDLITAFDKVIKAINAYEGEFYLLENFLLSEFEGSRKAAREFRRHLGFIDHVRFNKAWNKYHDGDEDNPHFRHYIMSVHVKNTILNDIKEILKFTK
ncbi:MAG: hypothetical protein GXP14_08070 [Gammaproteobacteria bacterium]|nr:hypothetical protein [Gammaproteobacteria bacterium]